jgi:hypothetical protein
MALVQVRNPSMAHNRTVFAKVALKNGMVVKLVAGTAKGEPCQVDKITKADLADPSVVKGFVTYIPDDDLAVDFILNPTNSSLSINAGIDNTLDIPAGAACVFWYNKPVIGLHPSAMDASIDMATIREGDKVAVNAANGKIGLLVDTATDANRDEYFGTVYEHEGAELTILCPTI